jgi:radical SAM-linked protein
VRLRIRFAKLGRVRWTSHRDVARMWERAFRRVVLPVAYSGGFAPRPRISFGFALPTGCESVAEYLDVDVAEPVEPGTVLLGRLSASLPVGVDATAIADLEAGAASLQQDVTSSSWAIELLGATRQEATELVTTVLAEDSLVLERERKGETVIDDVRPAIRALAVDATSPADGGDAVLLLTELATQPRGLRPSELAAVLGDAVVFGRIRRLHQWIERDGARREPLPLDATGAPHACERAS